MCRFKTRDVAVVAVSVLALFVVATSVGLAFSFSDDAQVNEVDAKLTLGSSGPSPSPSLNQEDLRYSHRGLHPNDTAVLWRGFRHTWSYNHRVNRLGSWVAHDYRGCDYEKCEYSVGHTGASGSGEDKASFRDAYTELSAIDVGFESGSANDIKLKGKEGRPDNGNPGTDEMISGTEKISLQLPDNMKNKDEYAVVLNGFDLKSKGLAAKFIRFNLDVRSSSTSVSSGKLTTKIEYDLLLDCDSLECKGNVKKNGKWRGGKKIQDVNYRLDLQYLAIAGDRGDFNVVRGNELKNKYNWGECENEVQSPTKKNQEDKWDEGFGNFQDGDSIPNDHMYCEGTGGKELDYQNYFKTDRINGKQGYSVGALGIDSMYLDTHNKETHFVQYDNIVGGDYDASKGDYNVKALPFYKEWSSRPGQYPAAATSYGHKGGATVKTKPVLLQIKDGCKRSFVHGGGLHWPGGGKNALSKGAVKKEENLRFSFGETWFGYDDRGSMCEKNVGDIPYVLPTQNPAYWVKQDSRNTRKNKPDARRAKQDPLDLTYTPTDRFYSDSNPPRSGYTDMSKLDVEFKDISGAVAESDFSGTVGSSPYFEYEAGNFPKKVEINLGTSGNANVKYAVLHRRDSLDGSLSQGTTEKIGPSTTVSDEGDYALEIAVNEPNKKPSVVIINFEVVSQRDLRDTKRSPGGVRQNVEYKLRGYDHRGQVYVPIYDWNTNRKDWKLTERGNSRFVNTADQSYTFDSEVSPEVAGYPRNDVVHDINLELDGNPIENYENITQPGTHNLTIYACYHAGGDCKDEHFNGKSPSGQSQARRPHGGKSGTQTKSSSGSQSSSRSYGRHEIAQHEITILGDNKPPDALKLDLKNYSLTGGAFDYYPNESKLTFQWTLPEDEGRPSSGIEKYEYGIDGISKSISDDEAKIPIDYDQVGKDLRRGQGPRLPDQPTESDNKFTQEDGEDDGPAYSRRVNVTASSGYHTFEIRAVDGAGNKGPKKTVSLCVIKRDCNTPAEKKEKAEKVEEAAAARDGLGGLGGMGPGGDGPCKMCDLGIPGWLAGEERVNIYVEKKGTTDPEPRYHARIKDGKLQELAESGTDNPSMKVVLDEKTFNEITSSENPRETIMNEYEKGNIDVQGVGVTNKIKFGTAKAVGGIYDFGTDVVGGVPGF